LAAAQPGDFEHTFSRGLFSFALEFSKQLVQAHHAHFRVLERGKMEQVLEFFLVLPLGIGFGGPHDAHARGFQDARDVIGRCFSCRSEPRHQLPPNLFDLGRREPRHGQLAGDFQDHFFFRRVIRMCHRDLMGLDLLTTVAEGALLAV